MSQIIEGVDNEVTLTFTFLTVAAAVVIPWYFMRPQRSNVRSSRSESSSSTNGRNSTGSGLDGSRVSQGSGDQTTPFEAPNTSLNRESTLPSAPQGDSIPGFGFRPEYLPNENLSSESTQEIPSSSGSLINVRVKLISDTERPFQVYSNMKLLDFKKLCFPEEFNQGKLIRFIYSGRILQPDNETLQHFNVGDGCVVHAQITHHRANPSGVPPPVTDDLDLSAFLVPFLTLALLLGWLAVFTVDGIFTWTSILILAFLTTMMLVTSWL